MSLRNLLGLIIIAGAAVLLLKKAGPPKANRSPVAEMVEETLQEHQGENSPVVQAFEAALAHETKQS